MNDQKRVLIFGMGRMGKAISWCMSKFGNHIISVDKDIDTSHGLDVPLDFLVAENENDYKRTMELCSPDLVISSLPYFLNESIAMMAIEKGIPYCDLGGSVPVSATINNHAEVHAKKPVITDLGLAPGWVNILAEEACDSFNEKIVEVKTMVGGLPVYKHNPPFNYTITWSIDGLINEYIDDCQVLIGEQVSNQYGMEGLEDVYCRSIDEELEAFYTSGGASHSIKSMRDRGVENFSYKTLRYKGHNEIIKLLLRSKIDKSCVKETIQKICTPNDPSSYFDFVIIKCIAIGQSGKTWDKELKIKGGNVGKNSFSSMQKATSFGISCVAEQIVKGDIEGGKLGYKDVRYDKFNEYLNVLKEAWRDEDYEIPLK